jgi:high-affinity iron transporter
MIQQKLIWLELRSFIMFSSLLIAFREGIEAAVILGIILAVCRRTNWRQGARAAWQGTAIGIVFSLVAGLILVALGMKLEGQAEKIYEGVATLIAAAMLIWVILWLHRGGDMGQSLRKEAEAHQGSPGGLRILAAISIGREGLELALFLIASASASSGRSAITGAAIGLGLATIAGLLMFAGSVRLPLKTFFRISSILLLAFAAGLVAYGVHELIEADMLPPLIHEVWNINHILHDKGPIGSVLKALFGYNGNPDLLELIAYALTWLVIGGILRHRNCPIRRKAEAQPEDSAPMPEA